MSGSLLAIETSTSEGSLAVWQNGGLSFKKSFLLGRKPSAALWAPLEEAAAHFEELEAIVVGLGPGSYNGVRIAIAAAQGIALAKGSPVVGISSFEGVETTSDRAIAIGDARRGSFSLQQLSNGRPNSAVQLLDAAELASELAKVDREEVFSFEEPSRFPSGEIAIEQRFPQAARLLTAYQNRSAEERARLQDNLLEPIYLRAPHITLSKRPSLLSR